MLFRETENKGLDFKLFGYLLDAEEHHPYHNFADIYAVAIGNGEAEVEIPISKDHLNSLGTVHGGVYAALLDASMGMAVMSKNVLAVTASLHVDYLQPAQKGDVLKGIATVTKKGKQLIYCEGKIYNQHEQLFAAGQGVFCVVEEDFVEAYVAKLRAEGRY